MDRFIAAIFSFALGAPIYLPWILARAGIYKRWYLAPLKIWGKAIFGFPASAIFVCIPFVSLMGFEGTNFNDILGICSLVGIILAVIMIIWTPRWAKPKWQRYLEDNYSQAEIRRCIPVWRVMDAKKWSNLLDSEEGIDELVAIARAELGQ